jgi:hypothetical protein
MSKDIWTMTSIQQSHHISQNKDIEKTNNMTFETLKKLIDREFDRFDTIPEIHEGVEYLLALYDKELETEKKLTPSNPIYIPRHNENLCGGIPDKVPYGTICPCNPANGGSGICGCTMGNQMVDNPAKYGQPKVNFNTTTSDTYKIDENFPGTITNTGTYEAKRDLNIKATM